MKLKRILREINADAIKSLEEANAPPYVADAFSDYIGRIIEALMNRWTGARFKQLCSTIAGVFVEDATKYTARQWEPFERRTGTLPTFRVTAYGTPDLERAVRLATEQNAQLITSIAREHLDAIANIVYRNVQAGNRFEAIIDDIKAYGVTKKRADFIARDQTAKVVSTISRIKQQGAGFRYFKWDTSHDERVREEHKRVAEARTPYGIGVYRWDDLPTIHGERMAPGMDYRCRCVALPLPDYEVEEWMQKHKST